MAGRKEVKRFLSVLPHEISIDVETTGLDRRDELVSAAIAWKEGDDYKSMSFWLDRFHNRDENQIKEFSKILKATLFCPRYGGKVIMHNLDFDIKFLLERYYQSSSLMSKLIAALGIRPKPKRFSSKHLCRLADTLTVSRVSRNNKYVSHADPKKLKCHSLKFLAKEYLDIEHTTFEDVVGYANIRFANRSRVLKYNEDDATITLKLYHEFRNSLTPDEWTYFDEIEMPHLLNLVHMNWHGVPYDVEGAKTFLSEIEEAIQHIEAEIFSRVGKAFNIASQKELTQAIFYNPRFAYRKDGKEEVLAPLYLTPTDQVRVDLDTIKTIKEKIAAIDPKSDIPIFLNKIMQVTEMSKAITFIEQHLSFAVRTENGYRLYPNFSAEAKSGRVKSSRPNMLGLAKAIFKKSNVEDLPLSLTKNEDGKDRSVRQFIRVPDGYNVESIDISALDLSVITHGAKKETPDFEWSDFFESDLPLDIHLSVARKVSEDRLIEALDGLDNVPLDLENYWFQKPNDSGVKFIHKETKEVIEATYKKDRPEASSRMKKTRNVVKEVNLSTCYLIGAASLATNIRSKIGENITEGDAQEMLDNFFDGFPEIRRFQDRVGNSVYRDGFLPSIFGRRYYAGVFDDLNEQFRNENNVYEFILRIDGKYWYLKTREWIKTEGSIVDDMKTTEKPFGFRFKETLVIEELDKSIFRQASRKKKKSKFNRKSEDNQDEISNYELTRIGLTNEIDDQLKIGVSRKPEAEDLIDSFLNQGQFYIPEKFILFYRVKVKSPSHRYFKNYKKFMRIVKEFFPLYCQGVANTAASICLTDARKEIEKSTMDARLLLFVHDQMDVVVKEEDSQNMRDILEEVIKRDKPPFDVSLKGELQESGKYIPS